MTNFKFKVSVQGENVRESNTWSNIINYATELAKLNIGEIVTVKSNNGHISESFTYCLDSNNLIPA